MSREDLAIPVGGDELAAWLYRLLAHLEIYIGAGFERLAADQVAFLTRHLLGQNNPS